MQAFGLVSISKKHNFVEISFKKNSECEKMVLGLKLFVFIITLFVYSCDYGG